MGEPEAEPCKSFKGDLVNLILKQTRNKLLWFNHIWHFLILPFFSTNALQLRCYIAKLSYDPNKTHPFYHILFFLQFYYRACYIKDGLPRLIWEFIGLIWVPTLVMCLQYYMYLGSILSAVPESSNHLIARLWTISAPLIPTTGTHHGRRLGIFQCVWCIFSWILCQPVKKFDQRRSQDIVGLPLWLFPLCSQLVC